MKNQALLLLTFIALILGFVEEAKTQTINYSYDGAGNRIFRTIQVQKSQEVNLNDTVFNNEDILQNSEVHDRYQVYPNPVSQVLFIKRSVETNSLEPIKFKLYNANGKLLEQGTLEEDQTEINIGNHSDGIYILQIWDGNKNEQWKILKQ